MMPELNPFYVGYQPKAAPAVRRHVRNTVVALAATSIAVLILIVTAQGPFAASRFEFGTYRGYEGELLEWPYPMLVTRDAAFLLAGEGKFGVANQVRGREGQHALLRGTLIERDGNKMLQVESGSLRYDSASKAPLQAASDLGPVTLTGEIVDTKCHLGVMNPGEGKVHRECAVRCISGGSPPGFWVRDASGHTRLLLLTGSDGRPLGREVLDYVAEPIRISGRLVRQGKTLIVKTEPRNFIRE
jgi:hypothetical protein